jgi:ABC-type sugar transport system substrate-binding protein
MATHRRLMTRTWRYTALLAALAAALLVATGCGSSSSSSDSSAGASSNSSGGVPEGVALAESVVKKAGTRPTTVSVTEPIGKTVPAGKKVVFISCGVEACNVQGKIIAQGAKDLGWSASTIATDGSPEKLQGAFDTALRNGADAVILNAVNRAAVAKQIAAAEKQGVAFVTCCSTEQVGNGILYNTSTADQNSEIGRDLAAQAVADSKGEANTLYVNISAFEILANLGTAFQKSYKSFCPDCSMASIDIPLTALGKDAPDRIVSYLRSHPKVNYVVLSVSDALGTGLPAALQAAGLGGKVKILGQGASTQIYQYISGGQVQSVVPFDYYAVDYQMLDALARHFAGVPIQQTAPPRWLMTKSGLPSTTDLFPVVEDYRNQFLKLWGKA